MPGMLFPIDEGWVTAMTILIPGGEMLMRGILSLFRAHLSLAASCRVPSPCQLPSPPDQITTPPHATALPLPHFALTLPLPTFNHPASPCVRTQVVTDFLRHRSSVSTVERVRRHLIRRQGDPTAPRLHLQPRRRPAKRSPPSAVLAGTPRDLQGNITRRKHRSRRQQPQRGSGCGRQTPFGLAQRVLGVPWRAQQAV